MAIVIVSIGITNDRVQLMNDRLAYLIMFVSVPILWVLAIQITGFPSFLLPPPDMVGDVLWTERELLASHTWTTIVEALTGYAVANAIAIALSISSN